MDGSQVGVLEEGDKVSLSGLLQSHDGRGLEAEVGLGGMSDHGMGKDTKRIAHLEVLSNLTNKTLEGELPDEELRRLLVATNLTESDGTGPEAMRLLDTTSRGLRGEEVV